MLRFFYGAGVSAAGAGAGGVTGGTGNELTAFCTRWRCSSMLAGGSVPEVPMLAHMTRIPWKNSFTIARMSVESRLVRVRVRQCVRACVRARVCCR